MEMLESFNINMSSVTNPLLLGAAAVGGTLLFLGLRKFVGGGVCKSKASLKGKTVIITGANAGIGLETAVDLAKREARIIMACRSVERGERATTKVKKMSGNDNVVFSQLDLSSLDSIRQFADRMLKEEPRIDILIDNAGVSLPDISRTVDGFEVHFATNHLGHFLLTNLLLDRLKEAPSARIVVVSSRMHHYHEPFDFEKVNTDDKSLLYGGIVTRAYVQSKLANVLFSQSLSRRLQGSSVTVNALYPGAISTDMLNAGIYRTLPFFLKVSFASLTFSLSPSPSPPPLSLSLSLSLSLAYFHIQSCQLNILQIQILCYNTCILISSHLRR